MFYLGQTFTKYLTHYNTNIAFALNQSQKIWLHFNNLKILFMYNLRGNVPLLTITML